MKSLSQYGHGKPVLNLDGGYPIYRSFPEDGARDVSTKIIPRITFTEPMLQETLNKSNLFLFDEAGMPVDYFTEVIAGSSVCLKPRTPFRHGEKYTIKFGVGIKHANGKTLNLSNFFIEFTTC